MSAFASLVPTLPPLCMPPSCPSRRSFIVPGLIMIALALLIFLFLVVHPSDVGHTTPGASYEAVRPDDEQVRAEFGVRQRTMRNHVRHMGLCAQMTSRSIIVVKG